MEFKNLRDAADFVKDELLRRGYEISTAVWVNDRYNALYTTINERGLDESFFLKFDRAPYYAAGREFGFGENEQVGVTINKLTYDRYVVPSQATILYALPNGIYHISQKSFDDLAIPAIQQSNKEHVMVIPFSKFDVWVS